MPFSITAKHTCIKWLAAVKADEAVLSCRCPKTVWLGLAVRRFQLGQAALHRATPSPTADHTRQSTSDWQGIRLSFKAGLPQLHGEKRR